MLAPPNRAKRCSPPSTSCWHWATPDGGWSQTVPELKSDAFATGQTLYALALAGYTAERPEIKRGIDFLVATQAPDGSWPMISRSTPDGSPGSSKLLDADHRAASSWATLGLSATCPEGKLTRSAALLSQIEAGGCIASLREIPMASKNVASWLTTNAAAPS